MGKANLAGPASALLHQFTEPALGAQPVSFADQPGATTLDAIESINRPKARVYQLRGNHLSVVMIVDEKLNV